MRLLGAMKLYQRLKRSDLFEKSRVAAHYWVPGALSGPGKLSREV